VVHKIGEVEKWNAYSIAYNLSNNCTKNYYNCAINIRIMLKQIASHAFLGHSV